jgi:tetratricopeptide (TPR) repeat protein
VRKFRKSINSFKKYLKAVESSDEDEQQVYLAHLNVAKAYFLWPKIRRMKKYLDKIINLYPQYAEGWVMLGDYEFKKQNWKEAIGYYQNASACRYPDIDQVAFDRRLYTYYSYDMTAVAYCRLNDFRNAFIYKKKALESLDAKDEVIVQNITKDLAKLEEKLNSRSI